MRAASAPASPAASEQARLAVGDDLGDRADARRDDGKRGEHRLEQNDPEPLPARRVREDVGALEPVARLDPAGQQRRVGQPERPRLRARLLSSGPQPRIASRASGCAFAHAGECVEQRGVVLLLDQASDRQHAAAPPVGIPACPGVISDGAEGSSSSP